MSQAQLAQLIGVRVPSVSDWERGATTPTEVNMEEIAKHLGVSEPWLRYGEPNGNGSTATLPRVSQGLPYRVRTWLLAELLDYAKVRVPSDELEDARRLFESPDVLTFYVGGRQIDHAEPEVLEGMKGIALTVRRSLRQRGFKVGPDPVDEP